MDYSSEDGVITAGVEYEGEFIYAESRNPAKAICLAALCAVGVLMPEAELQIRNDEIEEGDSISLANVSPLRVIKKND